MKKLVSSEIIEKKIFIIRGHKVMLDKDLAELYGVSTKRLNEQVKRNKKRFPIDFMFKLTKKESFSLRSQNATLEQYKHYKYLPYAFTEHGVAMLSGILNSNRAIQVNIAIMRAFVKLRAILSQNRELKSKLSELERKIEKHDTDISTIFEAIRRLMAPDSKSKKQNG